jgi:flagellar hook protein FlgE
MSTFSISVAGMLASEEGLGVISNNLANMNTVGFKTESPDFSDLVYQQLGTSGSGSPIQAGMGTTLAATDTEFTEGGIQSTGVPTDVAIQGAGFLQIQKGGLTLYTRDGNLMVNSQGYLTTQDGGEVMGYTASKGVVQASGTLQPLMINSSQSEPASATQNVNIGLNLDATTPANGSFSTTAQVFDSLGTSHLLTYTFTNTGTNAWSYQITVPAADVGQTGNPVVINSGNLTFDGSGNLTAPSSNVTGIKITGLADGANDMNFDWNLYNSDGSSMLTQVAGASSANSVQQDGYASGTLSSFTIGQDGTIQGSFTNGQSSPIGQIALASFPNNQGLLHVGSNDYMASLASGLPATGVPGTGGRGTLTDGALENSNVDIASQFAQLITAQNGYQSDSKAFTTYDTIIQTTLNLIQ